MKKKITAILCAACMLCAMLPLSVSAAGNLEGVDYTRITSGTGYQVKLTLGDLEFWGDLSRGTSLSDNEQDKIIRQVMVDQKITSGMLINAPSIIAQAELVEGFSMQDAINAILKLTGAGDLLDLYDIIMGSSKPPTVGETIKDMAIDKLKDQSEEILEDALTKGGKIALKGGGKFALKLFFLLPDLTEIGLDALTKYENLQAAFALALEKKTMLERFYDECNKRIAQVSGDGGEWRISFAGPRGQGVTAVHNFNMWGIGGLMADWTLTGELVRQITGAGDDYGGTYQGSLTLEIKGVDMANSFDKRFAEVFNNSIKTDSAINTYLTVGVSEPMTYTVKTINPTVLSRIIVWDILVSAPNAGSGEFALSINSFQTVKDELNIFINHYVEGYGQKNLTGLAGSLNERWHELTIEADNLESVLCVFQDFTAVTNPPPAISVPKGALGEAEIKTIHLDPGTAWKPLESSPAMTLYLK